MNEPSSIADRVGREAGGLLSVSARSERSRLCIFLSYFLLGLKRRSWVWTTAYTCRADDLEWHTFNLSTKRAVENLQRGGWRGIERRQMGDRAGLNNLMGVCQLEMPPTRREEREEEKKTLWWATSGPCAVWREELVEGEDRSRGGYCKHSSCIGYANVIMTSCCRNPRVGISRSVERFFFGSMATIRFLLIPKVCGLLLSASSKQKCFIPDIPCSYALWMTDVFSSVYRGESVRRRL